MRALFFPAVIMNPAQPPSEDLSSRFDAESPAAPLTPDEVSHLRDWQALGDDLRALPVRPVNLLPGVMREIETSVPSLSIVPSAHLAADAPNVRRGADRRSRVATMVAGLSLLG